jgi:glycosyltransferase involved in cell wall biosynthesis
MTRYGMNPARDKNTSYRPARVTAGMMTYIPNLEGYFTHRLDVLRLSLESLIQTTKGIVDIAILDNGSCNIVRDYLDHQLELGRIDYLIHSRRNLGVIGGLKVLFNSVLGDIIAYSDDDVLYYPGWLDAHLSILETFPNVGMVSGAPVGYSSEHAVTAVDDFIAGNPPGLSVVEKPRNAAWEESWAISTGRSVTEHRNASEGTPNLHLNYRGVEAVRSSKHFQFVTPRAVICQAFSPEWTGSLMDGLVSLDESVDRLGYLRLCTPTRYARHIGNAVSEEIMLEAEQMQIALNAEIPRLEDYDPWILKIPGSGRILWPLYRWLFRVLHKVR